MKRFLLITLLILSSNLALSQHLITGWKTGFNMSRLSITSGVDYVDEDLSKNTKSQFGFEFGVFKDLSLNDKWSVNANVFYQLRRSETYERKRYFSYLNINPNIRYHISNNFKVFTGVNTGILINALEVYDKISADNPAGSLGVVKVERNVNKYYTTLDVQWMADLEVKLSDYLGVELSGAMSLHDLNAEYNKATGVEFYKLKFYTIGLSAKYYFK